ncbi:MAG: hypothetical protein H0Z38_00405 [Firmicutes bacterium]|nr:hypothetical protein [Bacillota bacterium]
MRKVLVFAVIIIFGLNLAASAASIVGSKHDLSSTTGITNESQVCIFCHTPHGASKQGPLWNREASTAIYTPYASDSLNATIDEIYGSKDDGSGGTILNDAGLTTGSSPDLCLSCHDGTVAVNSLLNTSTNDTLPTMTAGLSQFDANGKLIREPALLGTDLSNDHPVNFIYSEVATADAGIMAADANGKTVAGKLPLFSGKMQCSTCHNVHDPGTDKTGQEPFLRDSKVGSAICLDCHNK